MQRTSQNRFRAVLALAGILPVSLFAQAPATSSLPAEDQVVLSPFTVTTNRDDGYRKANAVTATRLGADLLNTPYSVTVISAELIKDLGVDTQAQAFGYAAANINTNYDNQLTIAGGGIQIRGFQSAFIYQDGVRRYNAFYLDGIDRVEVVKGPVFYFGRSDPGGIVSFVTKKPEFMTKTTVEGRFGSNQFYKAVLDTQGVIAKDALAYRILGSYRDSDSWMAYTHWKEKYALGELTWRPTKTIEILAQYEHLNQFKTGGRVPALIANLDYLKDAGAFGGPNTLHSTLIDADGNPATPPVKFYESVDQWSARKFAETGKDYRIYNGYWFPRGHSWDRNGSGTFDDNKNDSFNLDAHVQLAKNLNFRALYNFTKTDAAYSWFINQDPHQAPVGQASLGFNVFPTFWAALANKGDPNLFTGMNYGFFESPAFNSTGSGGGIPGRQADLNSTHTIQTDLVYNFEVGPTKHTFVASTEFISGEYTQFGYVTDVNKFVAAGGLPGQFGGYGNLSAAAQAKLNQEAAQLQALGLLGTNYPGILFSGLWGNLTDPNFVPPDQSSWLAGRTKNSQAGSDSIDKAYSLSYRGQFFSDRLSVNLGYRWSDFRQANASETDGTRSRDGASWVKFTKNTPTAGVVYAVKPGLNAYASFSENFYPRNAAAQDLIKNSVTGEQRGGGVNAPEIGRGYEFGLKTLSADGKISGSIALFRIDRSNMPLVDTLFANRTVKENEAAGTAFPWRNVTQNNAPITQANAPQLTLPIGRQRVEGVEIESVYAPARNWQIIFAASHNFTRRWRELPPDRLNVAHGGTFTGYNGQNDGRDAYSYTLPNIPANQASIFSKYTLNDGKYKGLYFTGGVQWQSDSQLPLSYDDRIDPFSAGSIQKAYYVVDLGVGYSFKVAARPLKLAFTVNNALNKEYITGSFGPAPTREWRVTATYQF